MAEKDTENKETEQKDTGPSSTYIKIFTNVAFTLVGSLGLFYFTHQYLPVFLPLIFDKEVFADWEIDLAKMALLGAYALILSVWYALMVDNYFDTRAVYNYVTKKLQTKISMADAASLKKIFNPTFMKSDKWQSMENITTLPEDMRREACLNAAKDIIQQLKEETEKAKEAEKEAKKKEKEAKKKGAKKKPTSKSKKK